MPEVNDDLVQTIAQLPPPLNGDEFHKFQDGIYESSDFAVMINSQRDFAFIHPRPTLDYEQYRPRFQKLGLSSYRAQAGLFERRLAKMEKFVAPLRSFLEIGASDGGFLAALKRKLPGIACSAIEVDQSTKAGRDRLEWLQQYDSFSDAGTAGARFDAIGMFHVFEHILRPVEFLADCRALLQSGGRLIIEVPSLTEPMIQVYDVPAFRRFYFQRQHPFVYSGASLERLLVAQGFEVEAVIPYQRYGLENHLNWLMNGEPGGNKALSQLLSVTDQHYRRELEESGHTDTVFVIASI